MGVVFITSIFIKSKTMDCFENIIGISRTDCECFSDEFNSGAAISKSGLYMDELSESPFKLSDIKAGMSLCDGLQVKMEKARANAITYFREALFRGMSAKYSQSAEPYSGYIGGHAFTKNFSVGADYAGIVLNAKKMHGATLTLKQIDTYFAQTSSFNVSVYVDDVLMETIPVESTAGEKKMNELSTPLQLPLTDENGTPYRYKIVYQTDGLTPKDNTIGCGCGHESKLDKFFQRSGVIFNDINQISTTGYAYGLSLVVNVSCGSDEIICSAYGNDAFFKVTAEAAIQRKAVEFLIIDLLSSKVINRETMTNREAMAANKAYLHNKFKNDVQWLAENMKIPAGGCFACNPQQKTISIGGIRL